MSEVVQGSALQVEELKDLQEKYFSDVAKVAVSKKAMNQFIVEDGKNYICAYFGKRVATDNVELGAQRISEIINELAANGKIHSALSGLIKLDLIDQAFHKPSCLVLCYVLVDEETYRKLEEERKLLDPASTPEYEGGFLQDLSEGEFQTEIRISHVASMLNRNFDPNRLETEINRMLKFLPEGTTVVRTKELPITDLSVRHEVTFFNPLLQDVRTVDLQSVRAIARLNGEIKEFNIVTGIRFFDKQGKRLYS